LTFTGGYDVKSGRRLAVELVNGNGDIDAAHSILSITEDVGVGGNSNAAANSESSDSDSSRSGRDTRSPRPRTRLFGRQDGAGHRALRMIDHGVVTPATPLVQPHNPVFVPLPISRTHSHSIGISRLVGALI
jgi:hypothetical protein